MSKIFISHSQRDNPEALAVAQWLAANGWEEYYIDISPVRGLAPGEKWQEALRRATHRCEAVIFLVSPHWLASRWCLAEFLLAKQLGKAIFGVIVGEVPVEALPVEMRGEFQLCNLVDGEERETFCVSLDGVVPSTQVTLARAGLARLKLGLQRVGLDPSTFPWPPIADPQRSPYSGLRALDALDAAVFFGRDASMTLALDTIRRLRETQTENIFVILGASGTGKSSFLRAGVLPRLARDDRSFLVLPAVRPERAAISGPNGLLNSLDSIHRSLGAPVSRGVLRTRLSRPEDFPAILSDLQRRAQNRLASPEAPSPTIALAIDQAEELFVAEHRAEADALLNMVRSAIETSGGGQQTPLLFVLLAIRSDSFERFQTHASVSDLKQTVFSLQPIPREEYRSIIEKPAERYRSAGHRLIIDPLLTQQLLADTQGADALPLLAFTLERLFIEEGGDGELSLADYERLGGVAGSIEAAVEAAFTDPSRFPEVPSDEAERNRLLHIAFVPWLARVDPDTEERKRRVASWDEIPAESRPVIERLIEQRLLTRDRRVQPGGAGDSLVVEVAHEALLRRWPMLTAWLDRDADALRTVEVTRRAAAEWVKHGRAAGWLDHSGDRLNHVEVLQERPDLDMLLGEEGRSYLRACRRQDEDEAKLRLAQEERLRDAEQTAQMERVRVAEAEAARNAERAAAARRLSRRTMIAAGIAAALMVVATLSAVSANKQARAAEHSLGEINVAEANRLIREGSTPAVLAHLAKAIRLDPNDGVWRAHLIRVLMAGPWARLAADLPTPDPSAVAVFSSDGKFVFVAAGDSGYLMDASTGLRVGNPLRHRNVVRAAAFSSDGILLVTAANDHTLRLWNSATGQIVGDPIPQPWPPSRVGFSPNRRLVLAAGDGQARAIRLSGRTDLWQAPNTSWHRPAAALSADGAFAVVLENGTANLWDLANERKTTLHIAGQENSARFSRGGKLFAISSGETTQVFDSRTGGPVGGPLSAHVDIESLDDDCACFVLSRDGTAVVVDLRAGQPMGPAITTAGPLRFGRIAANGARLVTISQATEATSYLNRESDAHPTGAVQVWDVASGRVVYPELVPDHESNAAFCPTGQAVFVWSVHGAKIFELDVNAGSSAQLKPPEGIGFAGFSRDCRLLWTLAGKQVRLWNAATGQPLAQPLLDSGEITSTQFSPEGRRLIATSTTGARLWDLSMRRADGRVLRHPSEYALVEYAATGERTVTADGDTFQVWDIGGRRACEPVSVGAQITRLLTNQRGDRVVVSARNGLTHVFDLKACKEVGRPVRFGPADTEAFWDKEDNSSISPDGSTLLLLANKAARLWSVNQGKRIGRAFAHRREITTSAFSNDGKYVLTASDDATVRVWSADSGEPVGKPMRHSMSVRSARFNTDGSRVWSISYRGISDGVTTQNYPRDVRVWETRTGRQAGPAIVHEEDVIAAALSPDGTRLITAFGSKVRIWDVVTGTPVGNETDFGNPVSTVQYTPDGRRIIIGSAIDVSVWDASNLSRIGPPFRVAFPVTGAVALENGEKILVISKEGESPNSESDGKNRPPRHQAFIFETPSGVADDAAALAILAEAVGGLRVNEMGALEPARKRLPAEVIARVEKHRRAVTARRLARWILEPATKGSVESAEQRERPASRPAASAREQP